MVFPNLSALLGRRNPTRSLALVFLASLVVFAVVTYRLDPGRVGSLGLSDGPFSTAPTGPPAPKPIRSDLTWEEELEYRKGVYAAGYEQTVPPRPAGALSSEQLAKTVHILSANMAFADLTVNYLCKAAKVAPFEYVVVAQDAHFHGLLKSLSIPSIDITAMGLSSTPSEATSFQTEAYRLVVEAKMLAVYEILSRGLNVFFADVDIVLNRDPVGDFRGDVDLIFQPDWGLAEGQDPDIMTINSAPCTGFYFMKSNNASLTFLRQVIERFPRDLNLNDQDTLRYELQEQRQDGVSRYVPPGQHVPEGEVTGLTYSNLPYLKYPPGWLWIHSPGRHAQEAAQAGVSFEPVSGHANYLVGHGQKVEALRGKGWWKVDDALFADFVARWGASFDAADGADSFTERRHWSDFCL